MIIAISLLAVGIALLILGKRGWTVGDAPHCRACGYDLAGIDSPRTCPECGKDLAAARAVRSGARRKVAAFKPLGLVIALSSLGSIGVEIYLSTSNIPPAKRPTWLLQLDARSSLASRADPSLEELLLRRNTQKIESRELAPLIENALARQADTNADWYGTSWPQLLSDMRPTEFYTEDHHARYLKNALATLEIETWRSEYRARPGRTVESRGFNPTNAPRLAFNEQVLIVVRHLSVEIDGEPIPLDNYTDNRGHAGSAPAVVVWWRPRFGNLSVGSRPMTVPVDDASFADAFIAPSSGTHNGTARSVAEIYLFEQEGRTIATDVTQVLERGPNERREITRNFEILVLSSPEDVLRYADTRRVPTPKITAGILGDDPALSQWSVQPTDASGWSRITGHLSRTGQPGDSAAVAGEVALLVEGNRLTLREKPDDTSGATVTTFGPLPSASETGGSMTGQMVSGYVRSDAIRNINKATVVLFPNAWHAAEKTDATIFWNEQITVGEVGLTEQQ